MKPHDITADWHICFQELAPKLLLYGRQWATNSADAEDIVQMAFVRWWQRNPGGDREHVPLLYATVRTIALDVRRSDERRLRRETNSEIALPSEEAPHFDPPVEDRENALMLERAMRDLSPEQREVVTLRIWAGLTFAEIAATTGETTNTVASRYRYALNNLHRVLEPLREDLGAAPAPALA
ncbi:MAG: sigW 4 [Verrucomicrobiaceae bacterium]|nr:sigW 4 [Verrucomicrobiaceae bacterium]MDB6120358.1 sigW 4 [Verrucomicrobiaceae bacterium]